MMEYYIYVSTGQILKSVRTSNLTFLKSRLKDGEFLGEGKVDDSKQMIVDGNVIDGQVSPEDRAPDVVAPFPIRLRTTQVDITKEELQSILDRLTTLENNKT